MLSLSLSRMKKFSSALGCLFWLAGGMYAQIRNVDSGWQLFANPEGRTVEQAKQWAIDQAKIRAIADEFGTRIQSETVQLSSDFNGQTDASFTELNVAQVKGEWVDTKEVEGPVPEVKDGEIWWSVRVQGRARPIRKNQVEFDFGLRADVLGLEAVESLKNGDRLRARFQSPVDGFVMFFYVEAEVVYALSNSQSDFSEAVKGQQVYSLFSSEAEWIAAGGENIGLDRLARYAWGFQVTNETELESQAIVVCAFATHEFAPPVMKRQEKEDIWTIDEERFERWLKQNMSRSDHFQVERLPIRIRTKQRY